MLLISHFGESLWIFKFHSPPISLSQRPWKFKEFLPQKNPLYHHLEVSLAGNANLGFSLIMCVWNIHTTRPPSLLPFCISPPSYHSKLGVPSLYRHRVSDIGRGTQGGVCGWHEGIVQMSIPLDSCSLPSDASHLRRMQQAQTSFKTICLASHR